VCNLASIALPMFVNGTGKSAVFDHQKLYDITVVVTRNLNKIIDVNYYPIPEARNSNMRHRPIGIGVQVRSATSCDLTPLRVAPNNCALKCTQISLYIIVQCDTTGPR
jgi:hypothetical protein